MLDLHFMRVLLSSAIGPISEAPPLQLVVRTGSPEPGVQPVVRVGAPVAASGPDLLIRAASGPGVRIRAASWPRPLVVRFLSLRCLLEPVVSSPLQVA